MQSEGVPVGPTTGSASEGDLEIAAKRTSRPQNRQRPTLAEPVVISKLWKNRRRDTAVVVSL
jgi:hypothetical protein